MNRLTRSGWPRGAEVGDEEHRRGVYLPCPYVVMDNKRGWQVYAGVTLEDAHYYMSRRAPLDLGMCGYMRTNDPFNWYEFGADRAPRLTVQLRGQGHMKPRYARPTVCPELDDALAS